MKQKDDDNKHDKPQKSNDKSTRVVPMGIMFVVLCRFSFYLGGIFCSEKNGFIRSEEVVKSVESPRKSVSTPVQVKSVSFPQCGADYQDYTPCTDPKRWIKYGRHRLTFMERHSPPDFDRKECLVPHLMATRSQSDGQGAKMNVGTGTSRMTGSTNKNLTSIGQGKKG